jgi:hypothetical protein
MCATRNLADEAFSFLNFGVPHKGKKRDLERINKDRGGCPTEEKYHFHFVYLN